MSKNYPKVENEYRSMSELIEDNKLLREKFHGMCQRYEKLWSKYCELQDEYKPYIELIHNLKEKLEKIDELCNGNLTYGNLRHLLDSQEKE